MAFSINITPELLAERLTRTFVDEIAQQLKQRMLEEFTPLIEKSAVDMANKLTGLVRVYNNLSNGQVIVQLKIDGVEKALDQLRKEVP